MKGVIKQIFMYTNAAKDDEHAYSLLIEYTPDFRKVRQWILHGCWVKGLSEETYREPLLQCITVNAKRKYYRITKETGKEAAEADRLYELVKEYTSGRLPKSKEQLDGIFTYTYC